MPDNMALLKMGLDQQTWFNYFDKITSLVAKGNAKDAIHFNLILTNILILKSGITVYHQQKS